MLRRFLPVAFLLFFCSSLTGAFAAERSFDQVIDQSVKPVADWAGKIIFFSVPINGQSVPIVLLLLATTAILLTFAFFFINIRGFALAIKTVMGRYDNPDAPGQISHFQALSAALSATVGLGNIAGVAIAIGLGGPGATFWMIVLGVFGMTTKFCECTLGVRYRVVDNKGRTRGGPMYYLSQGFKERGLGWLGVPLAVIFAIMTVGGAFGAGNMFQVNQATSQFVDTFGVLQDQKWLVGLGMAIIVGLVILGGIRSIAKVAATIVPAMCILYVLAAVVVVLLNADKVPAAFATILSGAFSPQAIGGGIIGVMIQGIKRAAFSNEAGLGSAPIAHSAVKTDQPASEGLVALLEPFIDTVVVCTMTALVIITTGMWKVNATAGGEINGAPAACELYSSPDSSSTAIRVLDEGTYLRVMGSEEEVVNGSTNAWSKVLLVDVESVGMADREADGWVRADAVEERGGTAGGIWLTSQSFSSVISWFPFLLTIAVILFAFSTMISWSYYGEQGLLYIFGDNKVVTVIYRVLFCALAVIGAGATLTNILNLSDAMIFAMVFPNLIALYVLLPVVKQELRKYVAHAEAIDKQRKG